MVEGIMLFFLWENPFFPNASSLKNLHKDSFFIPFIHGGFLIFFEKGLNLVPLVEGGDSNH